MSKQKSGIEMAQDISMIQNQLPLHLQAQAIKAELYYKFFQDLVKQGFSEHQALEIIKARGLD